MTLRSDNQGDMSALIREFGPAIRAYLAARTSNWPDAEGLVQETFVAAFEGRDSFRNEGEFGAWLYGIARNRLRLYYRRKAATQKAMAAAQEQIFDLVESAAPGGSGLMARERIGQLRKCIAELPERAARVIEARYFENQEIADLARSLQTSEGAVYTLLTRLRRKLRTCMTRELRTCMTRELAK